MNVKTEKWKVLSKASYSQDSKKLEKFLGKWNRDTKKLIKQGQKI